MHHATPEQPYHLLYTEALPQPSPADPLSDIHSPEFWEQDTINLNRALAHYQAIRTREATVSDLSAFAAESIRLVLRATCEKQRQAQVV
jgi:hypothetical protein